MWQLWHRKTHFLCNHRNRMWSHVLNHTSQIGSGFVWKFFCWMLTRIKYCKLPPLLCKDSRQKEVKPQLCWDKIESHSSHLSLWSRISGWCRLLGDPGPGDLGGSLGAAGRARNFRTLITTETVSWRRNKYYLPPNLMRDSENPRAIKMIRSLRHTLMRGGRQETTGIIIPHQTRL